jgi:hypothetical protein
MNQDLKNIRENSGRVCDLGKSNVLEFNGLWHMHDRRDCHDAHCCLATIGR